MSEPPNSPYRLAVRFPTERTAGRVYQAAQQLLFTTECELSAYRFYMGLTWYVAIVGEPPAPGLEQRLRAIPTHGLITDLPEDIVFSLLLRRAAASGSGPWVERHYR